MVITHMEVARKMLNIKYKIFFSIIAFSFLSLPYSVLAIKYGSGSYGGSLYSTTIPGVTATPIEGTYNKSQQINLSTETGNTIRYSLVSTPTNCSSGNLYTTPIEITKNSTIYTLACDIYGNSTPNSFDYVIKSRSASFGSTIQNRINNLIYMGKTDKAQELAKEYNIGKETKDTSITTLTKTLKKGMINNEVKLLQIFLNKKGYIITPSGGGSPGNETNFFGPMTKRAVILFQKANNLTPDGIIGPLSIKVINNTK